MYLVVNMMHMSVKFVHMANALLLLIKACSKTKWLSQLYVKTKIIQNLVVIAIAHQAFIQALFTASKW